VKAAGLRLLGTVAVSIAAIWLVGALDAGTILRRGGSTAVLLPVHGLLCLAGLLVAGLSWPALEAAKLAGEGLRRLMGRWGWPAPGADVWPAALAGLWLTWALIPAHDAFTLHPAGTWLFSAYAAFPMVFGALVVNRLRRWLSVGRPFWRGALVLGAVLVALAAHHVNSRFLIGLYPPLHRGLTFVSVGALVAAAVWLFAGWPARRLGVVVAGFAISGGLALGLGDLVEARPGVFFLGTELRHVAERLEPLVDGDGDGIPGRFGGTDCDDTNPAVHPLAFERAGNDVDENCRQGALKGKPQRPLRLAPVPPKLADWRAGHPKPNVVVLFVDTWRWDYFNETHTPALAKLAKRSTVFSQARTTAPRTPLAWMGILRARFLGRCLRCRQSLHDPKAESLPRRFKAAGYATQARLVGKSWKRYHAADGYDRAIQRDSVGGLHGHKVVADLRRMLRSVQNKAKPFFLLGHFADAHAPYKINPKFAPKDASMQAHYAAEVRFTDYHVGRLLEDLERFGRMKDTVIVVFADHGENLGEHGDAGGHHGVSLFDEVVRVPLMIYVPDVAPRTVNAPVSLADLGPTLLALAGARPLRDADGRSLAGYFFDAPPPEAPTISEFYDFDHRLRAIVHGRHKLIEDAHHGVRLLFDVVADPGELNDLLAERPEVAAGLQTWLDTWVEHGVDAEERGSERCRHLVPLPKSEVESLKAKKKRAKAAGKK
jgi:arylsulfatase A-like enzyme